MFQTIFALLTLAYIGNAKYVSFDTSANEINSVGSAKENCTCVPYFQCDDDTGEIILDGRDLMDSR